jgi:23S rRNA pseudouridine1911/1915/1917 synthase
VTKNDSTTLLDILQERLPQSSKTSLRQLLAHDRILVNGSPERNARRPVGPGDRVEIAGKSARLDPRLRIIFEDADLIVVEKAESLLTVAGREAAENDAESLLNSYLGAGPGAGRIHTVHRLDRDASGVLVFAKNAHMRDRLKDLFALHAIERVYVAIARGSLPQPAGTLRSFLAEDRDLRVRSVKDASAGKEAITHYRTTASGPRYSMLELTLETGRRNQIRVHLAEAGHPILGDRMYDRGGEDPLGRLALHARYLGFVHPASGKRVGFTAEEPRAFHALVL